MEDVVITYDLTQRQGLPKYEYLFQRIRDDIRSGVLASGARLPSKKSLAHNLSVSVSTIEGAYDLLVSNGYVTSRPGSGFYVTQRDVEAPMTARPIQQNTNSPSKNNEAPTESTEPSSNIDMHANSCSLDLFPADTWTRLMRRVLSEKSPELFETVPFNGLPKLRHAIAQYLYEFKGMQVDPNCVIIGAGTEYLYTRVLQLLGPGTVIGIGDIGFKKLTYLSSVSGAMWAHVPIDEEGLVIEGLARTKTNVAHVSPANNFPIGAVMSSDRREQLLDWVSENKNHYIVEDDYDSELRFSGRAHPPLYTQDQTGRVIYLNTFSKTLVPSLRISYLVLPKALMDVYEQQLSFYSCTVSSFEQSVLAEFITRGYFERHINRLRRFYDKQRKHITNAILASPLASISRLNEVNVGTHMIMDVDTHLSDLQVKEAARAQGMSINTLSDYCIQPTARTAHAIVINFASIVPEQIDAAIETLEYIFAEDIERKRRHLQSTRK